MADSQPSQKTNLDEKTSRVRMGNVGRVGLARINGLIYEESKTELQWPQSNFTFKRMSYDSAVAAANNVIDVYIGSVPWHFTVRDDAPQEAKDAADFLNYCKDNMKGQTWREAINEFGSFKIYGYHVAEKLYSTVQNGRWKGKKNWKKLSTRSQDTFKEWEWDGEDDLSAFVQDLGLVSNVDLKPGESSKKVIPRNKFMLFTYNKRRENPQGTSPLISCYIPYKYKTFYEEQLATGVLKDLSGIVDLGIEAGYLAKAMEDPSSLEGQTVANLETQAELLHNGETTYLKRPIVYDDSGKPLFEFKLLGIQGSSKGFDLLKIIESYEKKILTAYLADVLVMGQDTVGSYSLADSKTNLMAMGIDHHLRLIAEVVNNDLVPQTLSLNGWNLEAGDMPYITYGDLEEEDIDTFSKAIQRIGAVNFLPRTQSVVATIMERLGLDKESKEIRDMDEEEFEELFTDNETGAGKGMTEGLNNGTGKSSDGRDDSVGNNENA